jgi:hypothetical protein
MAVGVKRANAECEYSPQQIEELRKCKNDPVYFIKNYVKIQHPKRGSVPFELYDYQLEMIGAIHNNKDTIMLCSRQMGKCVSESTTVTTIQKPNWFKRFILFLVDKKEYAKIASL